MRHGSSNNRRSRNRGGGQRKGNNQKTQVFDSNGPDVRIRGTAFQVSEKYVALAKDAQGAGDMVLYQSYLQHAEHYQRLINSWETENQSFEISDVEHDKKRKEPSKPAQNNKNAQSKAGDKADDEADLGLPSSMFGESSKDGELELS
ncbi:MAG: hypothetical protein CMH27_06305 [Micavibrio sp.]|nr:hypothetical protein [Micavibrio sp.]|tara:strand:- start:27 stop:467 length:441 start_codon:yes stop_codon:yes gene_type:complete